MSARFFLAISAGLLLASPVLLAQHPTQVAPRMPQITVPSSQGNAPSAQGVGTGDISAGIKRHIASERKNSADKKFHLNYRGKTLALDLVRVHDDRLSALRDGRYFACVDMKAADGTIYDIDFFMTGQPGSMSMTETSVHKINGKPLYNWKEQGGVWKKVRAS